MKSILKTFTFAASIACATLSNGSNPAQEDSDGDQHMGQPSAEPIEQPEHIIADQHSSDDPANAKRGREDDNAINERRVRQRLANRERFPRYAGYYTPDHRRIQLRIIETEIEPLVTKHLEAIRLRIKRSTGHIDLQILILDSFNLRLNASGRLSRLLYENKLLGSCPDSADLKFCQLVHEVKKRNTELVFIAVTGTKNDVNNFLQDPANRILETSAEVLSDSAYRVYQTSLKRRIKGSINFLYEQRLIRREANEWIKLPHIISKLGQTSFIFENYTHSYYKLYPLVTELQKEVRQKLRIGLAEADKAI